MKVLITGAAGFVGLHTAKKILDNGFKVIGVDSLNDYYDVGLKKDRIEVLSKESNFDFFQGDLSDRAYVQDLIEENNFDIIVHLAAQPGVRYSLENPHAYTKNNIDAFLNLLESSKEKKPKHFIYASSSSVYGDNSQVPFSVDQKCDRPVSFYAATKRANELMAHTYAHLYQLPLTGLRFFTVYGPWGRPDMAPFLFTKAILEGKAIQVYNEGKLSRDFTYVGDIAQSIAKLLEAPPNQSENYYRLLNIGAGRPTKLLDFIQTLEAELGQKAEKKFMPFQAGDVHQTYADTQALEKLTGFAPQTSLKEGIHLFIDWYKNYYGQNHDGGKL